MRRFCDFALLLCLILALPSCGTLSADTNKGNSPKKKNKKDGAPESVEAIRKQCEHLPGLFDLYRHKKSGKLFALIKPEQLDQEFIHFTYVENGVARTGHHRGNFRGSRIFTLERDYDRLRFVLEPVAYHFDPASALARSADANVSRAVLASEKVIDEQDGTLAIALDGLFLTEAFHQVKPADRGGGNRYKLGKLSSDKTRYAHIGNYEKNTDLVVEYTYEDKAPKVRLGSDDGVVDSRYVTIKLQHSLIAMPENEYQPRFDDERVGFFTTYVTDMTSTSPTPWRDLVHRWNLVKADPTAQLSEPVEPITFWIENTTPQEWRDTVRDAALRWNIAFEAAGFKNAVQVKVQPDDADWDAGDLRYNVLRWTSSPSPPFGGYGPSFVNPRTGQILGADIMLEWVFMTNRVKLMDLYDTAALEDHCGSHCSAGQFAHLNTMVGLAALRAADVPDVTEHQLLAESLHYLVLHEIGHTLGLNHNMASTQLHDPDAAHDKTLTSRVGLSGSVMDYPAVNLAAKGQKQGQYFTDRPGPYDLWAIQFGYDPNLSEPEARAQHLSRSSEPQLLFGNDADDMRSSGRGIDPRVMVGDMTGDTVAWAEGRFDVVSQTIDRLLERYREKGHSRHAIRDAYFSLQWHRRGVAGVVSRYIGGVYVDRSHDAPTPYRPVPYDVQKKAMKVLTEHVFADNTSHRTEKLLSQIRSQRRGFNFFSQGEDPKLHDTFLRAHQAALGHLLHANTLKRLTDSRLYGNRYSVSEMLGDLTAAVFPRNTTADTVRQNLQIDYVRRLIQVAGLGSNPSAHDAVAQSAALYWLEKIREQTGAATQDPEIAAHRNHVEHLIVRALHPQKDE